MLQRGDRLDLAEEPLGADHRGQLGPQHLDRDLAPVLEVLGEVDGGHAALAELALDPVAVGEGGTQTLEHGLVHRGTLVVREGRDGERERRKISRWTGRGARHARGIGVGQYGRRMHSAG